MLGVGCASFGHSCYGGHGKRSEPAMPSQEIDASEIQQQQQPPIAIMRILQRRLNLHSEPMTNELMEGEREVKITILAVLKDVVDETYRKLTTKDQDIPT